MAASPKGGLLDALHDPIEGVDSVLQELENPVPSGSKEPRFLYLRLQEQEPRVDELAELLSDQLVNYVIPLHKRREANSAGIKSTSGGDTARHRRLAREATRLLIQYNNGSTERYGELGELISYVIAIHFLGAPQIGSKIWLKTSSEMPVHGVDGLHMRANEDGSITFFLLESKLFATSTSATYAFCESIATFKKDRRALLNELRLVTSLSNLDALPEPQRSRAIDYFDPYANASLKRRDRHLGSLVYTEKSYREKLEIDDDADVDMHEKHLAQLVAKRIKHMKATLASQAEAQELNLAACEVFLIAVPDVEELKRKFAELNDAHLR